MLYFTYHINCVISLWDGKPVKRSLIRTVAIFLSLWMTNIFLTPFEHILLVMAVYVCE